MLTHIQIKNFTIVEQLSIDFQRGLSVLSGETGAGKSIWVDAVQVALGQRADSHLIRQDQAVCEITLCFDITELPGAVAWFEAQDWLLSDEPECIIRRVIKRQGSSRSFINNTPCAQSSLRELGELLLGVHSQYQQQHLLKPDGQQQQLDRYAGNAADLAVVAQHYRDWQVLSQQIDYLLSQRRQRDEQLSLLNYQMTELDELSLEPDEWNTLTTEHRQLHGLQSAWAELNRLLDLISEDEKTAAVTRIYQALHRFHAIQGESLGLSNVGELLNNAVIALEEAANELREQRDRLDLSEQRLTRLDHRLSLLHEVARKHHTTPEQLWAIAQQLAAKRDQLLQLDEQLAALRQEQQTIIEQYTALAIQITQRRQAAIEVINREVTAMMPALGMPDGQFVMRLQAYPTPFNLKGHEHVVVDVSTNPGQPLRPLAKIVSGGELSRLSLALQVLIAQQSQTPTLIFDEVDVGIGGKTAAMVGELLRELAQHTQVLCITHLPQVAAYGEQHYAITKHTQPPDKVHCQIQRLTTAERVDELARMLGGSQITAQTRSHAEEMLALLMVEH